MKSEMGVRQTIAWFKLAEFVNRGEKERALSLFRLLTHSFDDKAFIKKLGAEVLASFDDTQAFIEYAHAAHLYKVQGDVVEAVAIYELLTVLQPSVSEHFEKVIAAFQEMGNGLKVLQYQKQLCELMLCQGNIDSGIVLFKEIEPFFDESEKLFFFKKIVQESLLHRYAQRAVITEYLEKSLKGLLKSAGEADLNQFLMILQGLDGMWYKDALVYVQNFI
mgnify:CR=1 FL=1